MNKITDKSGNYITYEYNENEGAAYISKISYTGNGTMTPYNTIEFIYTKQDEDLFSNMVYTGGTEVEINKLVDSILVKAEGTRIKSYDLVYTEDEDVRLTEVLELGSDYTKLNSINIVWNEPDSIMSVGYIDLSSAAYSVVGDVNNDGFADLIYVEAGTYWDWYIKLGTENGISSSALSGSINYNAYAVAGLSTGDTDNDGSDEIIFFTGNGSGTRTMYIYDFGNSALSYKSSQTITSTEDLNAQAVDFTGDGLNELVVYEDDGDVKYSYGISSFPGDIILGTRDFVFDFNGNGKADILVADYNTLDFSVYEYDGSSFDYILEDFEIEYAFVNLLPGDFNGDGKSDILVVTEQVGNRIYYSTGKELRTYDDEGSFILSTDYNAEYDIFLSVQDFNGDGHSDIISYDYEYYHAEPPVIDHELRMFRFLTYTDENSALDTYFNNDFYFDPGSGNYDEIQFGDFNGDGNADMIYDDSIRYFFPLYKGVTVDTVFNSINDFVTFDYETIARDDDYSTSGVSSPYIPFHPKFN